MLIEPILGYKSSWRILSLLFETPRKLVSRQELFQYTNLGNAPLSKGLQRLVLAGIIIKEKKGKKEFYYVNQANEYSKLIKEIWEKERTDLRILDYEIKIILSEFVRMVVNFSNITQIILFGSWAKGTASIRSDIDLAVIFEKDLQEELHITKIVQTLEKKYSKEIQTHYFTENSFKQSNKLTNEIKNEGINLL